MFRVIMALVMLTAVAGAEWLQYDDGTAEEPAGGANYKCVVFTPDPTYSQGSRQLLSIHYWVEGWLPETDIVTHVYNCDDPDDITWAGYIFSDTTTIVDDVVTQVDLNVSGANIWVDTTSDFIVMVCALNEEQHWLLRDFNSPGDRSWCTNSLSHAWSHPTGAYMIRCCISDELALPTTWGQIKAAF